MSVRNGLLALLAEGPGHAYQLRVQFEQRTGGTWPLNIGQVVTTLQRLVRDGLVEPAPDAGGSGAEQYRLTPAGRAEADAWWATPVDRDAPARDELAIKLALAVTAPAVDVVGVVAAQRTATLRRLRDLTRLKVDLPAVPDGADLAWSLVLDNLVFAAEAEVRWLDHVEARVARAREGARATPAPAAAAPTTDAPSGARSAVTP